MKTSRTKNAPIQHGNTAERLWMATTLARKAWYKLEEFTTAKKYGIDRFTLTLERKDVFGQEQWYGTFGYGSKKLKVSPCLVKIKAL